MGKTASEIVEFIRQCVELAEQGDDTVLDVREHFLEKIEARGILWVDVLEVLLAPSRIEERGVDDEGPSAGLALRSDCLNWRSENRVQYRLGHSADHPVLVRVMTTLLDRRQPIIETRFVHRECPEGWIAAEVRVRRDPRTGEISYTPSAMRTFDRLRALLMQAGPNSTPGHLRALRGALGLSQQEFADRLKVSSQTVSRWERGESSPGKQAIAGLRRMQNAAKRNGVAVPAGK